MILEETHYDDFVKYANENLVKNFEYLFLAAQFSTFTKDRPGFEKVFHGLADSAWNKGLDMIKEISKRGVTHSFEKMSETAAVKVPESQNEVKAMAEASEIEKKLLEGAMNVFRHHSHASKKEEEAKASGFDAGIAHFVEEEIIEGKTETVRTLVGHVNDLMKLVEVNKAEDGTDIPSVSSLGIYLFDQYLQK